MKFDQVFDKVLDCFLLVAMTTRFLYKVELFFKYSERGPIKPLKIGKSPGGIYC